ncbi:uncharacterized protein LOC115770264 [Drosophila novamexicana]|uniref:uncharacterized protein LOC115770264 n=1 Tax=Drosophila novamexicana TaxID=47314 RepID=UPI0011E5FB5E|nr:uncharacterized protein LOC115770264 [Drosophila novamexicana]
MSRILLSSLVLILIANLAMTGLVPSVSLNGVEIQPIGYNKYQLRIKHSDGSILEEIVEKTNANQYEVRGQLSQPQFSPYGRLFLTHKAAADKGDAKAYGTYQYIQPVKDQGREAQTSGSD